MKPFPRRYGNKHMKTQGQDHKKVNSIAMTETVGGPAKSHCHPSREVESGDSAVQKPDADARVQYYQMEKREFLPFKAAVAWSTEKDIEAYVEIWGKSDDYRRDTSTLVESNLAQVHVVLES